MLPHMYCAGDDLLLTELHGVDHCCLGSVFLQLPLVFASLYLSFNTRIVSS